jgi:NAD(P)-dependent dehydrogenase (short-subunit alcohol dehydrogenase family)
MTESTPIVLITGARGGIGRALCHLLQSEGWRVAAVGRDAALLEDVPAQARIAADTTTPEGAALAIAACSAQLGAPTHLAHCVGSTLIAPLHRTTPAQWREVLRVNLESALATLGAWIESRRAAQAPGAAVLVSSVVAGIGCRQPRGDRRGQGRGRRAGAQRRGHLCGAGAAGQRGGAGHDRHADDGGDAQSPGDARRRGQAISAGRRANA